MTESRTSNAARRRPTDIMYLLDGTQVAVGQKIRINDDVRPKRFAGKNGTICEVRLVGKTAVEIGVIFGASHTSVWFEADELSSR